MRDVRRLARPTAVYGAATAATGIAVAMALEAWERLQHPDGAASLLPTLVGEALMVIALPVLAVATLVGVTLAARALAQRRGGSEEPTRARPTTTVGPARPAQRLGRAVGPGRVMPVAPARREHREARADLA